MSALCYHDASVTRGSRPTTDDLTFKKVTRKDLQRNDCPWFDPQYWEGGDSECDEVFLAFLGDECVCYVLYEEQGSAIELKYVENAPNHHGKGYAIRSVQELIRQFPDRPMWAVPTHLRAPNLLRKAGFRPSEEENRNPRHFGLEIEGAWVRFP
jgi:hypothetical protein